MSRSLQINRRDPLFPTLRTKDSQTTNSLMWLLYEVPGRLGHIDTLWFRVTCMRHMSRRFISNAEYLICTEYSQYLAVDCISHYCMDDRKENEKKEKKKKGDKKVSPCPSYHERISMIISPDKRTYSTPTCPAHPPPLTCPPHALAQN